MSKKDLSVLKLKNSTFKEDKIKSIYYNFRKKLNETLGQKPFLVAVSGGPDSLALAALSNEYKKEKLNKVYFVLVDHRLRTNSTLESKAVKNLLKKKKINLTVLTNNKKIEKNIQSNARNVRYKLLSNYCRNKKIKYILTGHHRDDQIETFLIRLSRGSGIQGLSSMSKITKLEKDIRLFRPLLSENKTDLVILAKVFFKKIFKDPSNKNEKYLRTKIRRLIEQFDKSGINKNQIISSINNLASTRDTLNTFLLRAVKNCVLKKKGKIHIKFEKLLLETEEIQFKIISSQIRAISSKYYPPRAKKVLNLLKRIRLKKVEKSTLGGCLVTRSGKELIISKEKTKKNK